jgi:hypothetical protein
LSVQVPDVIHPAAERLGGQHLVVKAVGVRSNRSLPEDCVGANAGPLMEHTVLALAVQVTLVLAGAVNAAVWQSTALALPVQA